MFRGLTEETFNDVDIKRSDKDERILLTLYKHNSY